MTRRRCRGANTWVLWVAVIAPFAGALVVAWVLFH